MDKSEEGLFSLLGEIEKSPKEREKNIKPRKLSLSLPRLWLKKNHVQKKL